MAEFREDVQIRQYREHLALRGFLICCIDDASDRPEIEGAAIKARDLTKPTEVDVVLRDPPLEWPGSGGYEYLPEDGDTLDR